MMNYNKMTKQQLIELLTVYEIEIDVLDVLINDIYGVDMNDVYIWLGQLYNKIDTIHQKNTKTPKSKYSLTDWDLQEGNKQLELFKDED